MKIVRVIGGLGNQMFQYAMYTKLRAVDADTYLDLGLYKANVYHNGYELERIFGLDPAVAGSSIVRKLAFYETGKISKSLRKFYRKKNTHFIESVIGYDKDTPYKGDYYYEGYWHSVQYFCEVEEAVQKCFVFPSIVDKKNRECLESIHNSKSVAVHIRRGDYLNSINSHFVNLGDAGYYERSIKYIKEKMGDDVVFYVFSDDIGWAKEKIKGEKCVYIDWNKNCDSYIDMQLMANCKGIIIANSTFSWWGAYLNPMGYAKNVVAPARWYITDSVSGKSIHHGEINLQEWHVIGGELHD